MSEQITVEQLEDHVGREVEVTLRGRIRDNPCGAPPDVVVNFTNGASWTMLETDATITLLPPPAPDEPGNIGSMVSVVVPNISYPTYYVRRFTRTDKDDCAPWMDLRSLDEMDWHSVVHGYGTPVDVQVLSEGVKTND